jgi:FMN phosphatase YigB (HAD superfamily)
MTVKNVLFDVGNVIASDYWEALWLTRDIGLADQLNISQDVAYSVGVKLWDAYSRSVTRETDYWADFSHAIGKDLPSSLVSDVERAVIKPNPFALCAVRDLIRHGIKVGLISNNTSFWLPKQLSIASIGQYVSDLRFISYELGVVKCVDVPDLFAVAARHVDASATIIFDDRPANVEIAEKVGFRARRYGRSQSLGHGRYCYNTVEYEPFDLEDILPG